MKQQEEKKVSEVQDIKDIYEKIKIVLRKGAIND